MLLHMLRCHLGANHMGLHRLLLMAWLCGVIGWMGCQSPTTDSTDAVVYDLQAPSSADGSGKVYMGREIASGSQGVSAAWHDLPARETSELPDRVVDALALRPADVVADIGAGTGFFTLRLAKRVPRGRVLAVDIDPDVLAVVEERVQAAGLTNVRTVQGTEQNPNLPQGAVDIVLIAASYHEFSHPREMMDNIVAALKPGGRFILVEYRGEDSTIPIPKLRRMTLDQARKEMEAVGLVFRETLDILPLQHFMIFEKPQPPQEQENG